MYKYLIIAITSLTILHAGIGDSRLSLLGEVHVGLFRPAAPNFTKIYGNDDKLLPALAFGVGYGDVFLVARYRLFEVTGQSLVTGTDLTGSAEWYEEIITLGLRTYESRPLYVELAYARGYVRESIATEQQAYSALNSTFVRSDNQGVSAAIGLNIPFSPGIYITGELEYIYMLIDSQLQTKDAKINLGGPVLSIGLSLTL